MNTRKKQDQKRLEQVVKNKKQYLLSVISVRISDEEKERIDEIMLNNNIKSYSDVLRIAIQLVQVPDNANREHTAFH